MKKTALFPLVCVVVLIAYVPVLSTFAHNQESTWQTAATLSASTLGGCHMFPSDNIWNYNISHLAVDMNSENYIAYIGGTAPLVNDFGNHGWGIPYNIVPGTQSFVPVHFNAYGSQSDPGPYPIPGNALVEQGSDHHVLVVDTGTCTLYELWQGARQADGSWDAGSGAIFHLNSDYLRQNTWTSADGAGLPIAPGLVRYDEIATGSILHALRVVLPNTQKAYVWPARHSDGVIIGPDAPPEGIRFRLKASVDISSFSPTNRIILTALKQYGMFVADKDNSTNGLQICGAPDSRWNESDLANLQRIHASDFEAVDESTVQVNGDSGQSVESMPILATPATSAKPAATATRNRSISIAQSTSSTGSPAITETSGKRDRDISSSSSARFADTSKKFFPLTIYTIVVLMALLLGVGLILWARRLNKRT